jgi:hypothetical protein
VQHQPHTWSPNAPVHTRFAPASTQKRLASTLNSTRPSITVCAATGSSPCAAGINKRQRKEVPPASRLASPRSNTGPQQAVSGGYCWIGHGVSHRPGCRARDASVSDAAKVAPALPQTAPGVCHPQRLLLCFPAPGQTVIHVFCWWTCMCATIVVMTT